MPFMDRSAFRTGIFYSSINNETEEGRYSLSQQFLKIPFQYGFTVIDEDIRSGFFVGPILGYGLKAEYTADDSPHNIYEDQALLYKRIFPGIGAGVRVEYKGISLEFQYNADILFPKEGFGSPIDLALGNEIISIWLGYSYSFAKKQHRYARRK